MDIVSMILSLLCGVSLFLFGMSMMGDGLKSVAGNKLESFLYKMTSTPIRGVLLGTGVTSVIQSSSATIAAVASRFPARSGGSTRSIRIIMCIPRRCRS